MYQHQDGVVGPPCWGSADKLSNLSAPSATRPFRTRATTTDIWRCTRRNGNATAATSATNPSCGATTCTPTRGKSTTSRQVGETSLPVPSRAPWPAWHLRNLTGRRWCISRCSLPLGFRHRHRFCSFRQRAPPGATRGNLTKSSPPNLCRELLGRHKSKFGCQICHVSAIGPGVRDEVVSEECARRGWANHPRNAQVGKSGRCWMLVIDQERFSGYCSWVVFTSMFSCTLLVFLWNRSLKQTTVIE